RDYWVVSTSNQKALVWNLGMKDSQASIEHYLHGHSRAITDINFSAHHPDILATCAVDSFVHCWDLRHPSRAATTFCDWFAGATQVKWNRQDSHILASSHNKFLRIWDDRKGAYPLMTIEAHDTKIYGVDWNRTETKYVATCSLDKTIKFWDYTTDSHEPVNTIHAPFPVWRARHTPFGSGLLAMPQRNDYDLHLYDRRPVDSDPQPGPMPMVHRFDGHEGQVKEFLWRARGSVESSTDSRDFQLVSWGADRTLRLHRMDESVLAKVGYVRGQVVKRVIPFTRKDAVYKSFRGDQSSEVDDLGGIAGASSNNIIGDAGMSSMLPSGMGRQIFNGDGFWARGEGASDSMAGRKVQQQSGTDAISWMKGVKIGKREPATGIDQSESSVLSPSLKSSQPWDTFETLAEEITYLADKFSKITFEDINMQDRLVTISLHAPWGSEKASIYVKCRIEIPRDYPAGATPWADVESTTGIDDETVLQINSDLQMIAYAFQDRRRHSLEVLLRYLLREQSRDECLLLLQGLSSKSALEYDQETQLSSSDEDDEAGQEYAGIQLPRLGSSDGMLPDTKAQYNVPLPKACGALWADDGRLVCFFPPKSEQVSSFLQPLKGKYNSWSLKNPSSMFDNSIRSQTASPFAKRISSDLETVESGDSDFDDSSLSTSSSSQGDVRPSQSRWEPSITWRDGFPYAKQAPSVDESQKSSGLEGRSRSATKTSKNFVSLHDCTDLLPSKQSLAEQYKIEGAAAACQYNASVSRKNGMLDFADVWDLVNLVIKNEVPLERMFPTSKKESILLIARRTVAPLRSKDSAIDLSYDSTDDDDQAKLKGRIYWGTHPFGRQWFIDALFDYFERTADIQMLAILSCVLRDQSPVQHGLTVPSNDLSGTENNQQSESSHPLAIAERYFPSAKVASSILQPPEKQPPFNSALQRPIGDSHSTSSSVGASTSDPMTPYSTGLTPPSSFRPSRISHERSNSQMTLSTSPEQLKHTQRSNSNLASTFAASIARPFSFSTQESSSPPSTHPKKRSSPATSYLGSAAANLTRGMSTASNKSTANPQQSKNRFQLSLGGERRSMTKERVPTFTTTLKNQDLFHNDGYALEPAVDLLTEGKYHVYRSMYANLLVAWGLSIAACEVLKYNNHPTSQVGQTQERALALKKSLVSSEKADSEILPTAQLNLYQSCTSCNATYSSATHGKECSDCSARIPAIMCQLCHGVVIGLSSPCLDCGHVLHLSCRSTLQEHQEYPFDGDCVTGCGCHCADHLYVNVRPSAIMDDSTPMVSAIDNVANEQEELGWHDVGEEFETPESANWGDVAYQSLARNLGAKFLTPKPSQIWRGGEARKPSLGSFPLAKRSDSG
ncbi:MAG: hypothetical protein Q9174_004187, partial [Haloplaca sp. 1 TL-2023]